jgi:F0F1-type ATP synthase assembly protein I
MNLLEIGSWNITLKTGSLPKWDLESEKNELEHENNLVWLDNKVLEVGFSLCSELNKRVLVCPLLEWCFCWFLENGKWVLVVSLKWGFGAGGRSRE